MGSVWGWRRVEGTNTFSHLGSLFLSEWYKSLVSSFKQVPLSTCTG